MTLDLERLKEVAGKLVGLKWNRSIVWDEWPTLANPATVLTLIAELEQAREEKIMDAEIIGELISAGQIVDDALASSEAANARMREASEIALGYLTGGMDGDWDGNVDPVEALRAALSPPVEGGLAYGDLARSGGDCDGIEGSDQ